MANGNLYIVATPIGNLKDITYRAIETLQNVDLIIAEDTRTSQKLLKHYNISNSISSYHKFNEKTKSINIIEKLQNGKNIALISDAGTPGISDPGNILINECINNNIPITPIPGSCALIQSVICSGFDTSSFSFYGFLNKNNKERKKQLENIKNSNTNISIIYESPHKLLDTLQDLYSYLGNVDLCISKEITKIHENHIRNKILNIIEYFKENSPKGEFVISINNSANLHKHNIYDINSIETQNYILKEYQTLKKENSIKDISKKLSIELTISKNDIYNFLINKK